ncbi:MAG: hypothetical protein WAX69_19055 [Victivallales bacterium]
MDKQILKIPQKTASPPLLIEFFILSILVLTERSPSCKSMTPNPKNKTEAIITTPQLICLYIKNKAGNKQTGIKATTMNTVKGIDFTSPDLFPKMPVETNNVLLQLPQTTILDFK